MFDVDVSESPGDFGCCWHSGGAPQSLDCWSSCNARGKMGAGRMEDDSGIITEDLSGCEGQNLGRRFVFMLMRANILIGEVVVVALGMMVVVVVGVVVVGVVVVVVGAISFSEKWCLSVMEVKCLGVGFGLVGGDILNLVEGFMEVVVEMKVDDLESEVGAVVRLVGNFLNGKLYFLWCLSRKFLEGKKSNDGERPFGMVMRADFLKEFSFFDGDCLKKVTGSRKEGVVVEMVVGVVENVV